MAVYSNARGTSEAGFRIGGPKGRDVIASLRHIEGFAMQALASSVVVGAGSAVLPNGTLVEYAGGTIAIGSTVSVGVGTMHNLYVGTSGVNVREPPVPALPSNAYSGSARTTATAGDRWIGAVRGKAFSSLHRALLAPASNVIDVSFLQNTGVDNILVSAGAAATPTTLNPDAFGYGLAMTHATIRIQNTGAGTVRIYGWDGAAWVILTNVLAGNVMTMDVPLDAAGVFQYDAVSGGASINCLGYRYAR